MTRALRPSRLLFVLAVATLLPRCGAATAIDNLASVATPQRVLVTQGSQSNLPPVATSNGAVFVVVIRFQAPAIPSSSGATVEGIVDWTFASNPVGIAWGRGDCTQNPNCEIIAQNTQTTKPKTVTAVNQQPGTYSLLVANAGTTNESISYQIFVTQ
jgi:hypothetical protein